MDKICQFHHSGRSFWKWLIFVLEMLFGTELPEKGNKCYHFKLSVYTTAKIRINGTVTK